MIYADWMGKLLYIFLPNIDEQNEYIESFFIYNKSVLCYTFSIDELIYKDL